MMMSEKIVAISDKSLVEAFIKIYETKDVSIAKNKEIILKIINQEVGTNYNVNALNNWLAERKPTPRRVQSFMRQSVIRFVFNDETAEKLKCLY